MNFLFLILIHTFTFVSLQVFSQEIFKNVLIPKASSSSYLYAQVEPSIALNFNNLNEIAIGTVMDDYYFSKDGGNTWTSSTLRSKYGVGGDPVLIFDKHNRIYFFHLSNYKKGAYLDRIVCQSAKTIDGKWNKGTFTKPNQKKAQDKQWVAYSHTKDELYMTWTQFDAYNSKDPKDSSYIMFSKSSNQGKKWSDPIRISSHAGDCLDSDFTMEGAVPTVGPNGEIYVAFSGKEELFFQRSLDGGKTWLKHDLNVGKQVGGWDLTIPGILRCNGFPILQCDTSNSAQRGRIYLNWADQRNGKDDTDSWLCYSDNQGETWSQPVKVNQDKGKKHQFFTWMTIDQSNGNIHVIYMDRRNHSDHQTDVYLSTSSDGGQTFTDYKLSEKAFLPNDKVFFGDYINVAAYKNKVVATWPAMNQGKISLWFGGIQF
jgi:hypothetical protein